MPLSIRQRGEVWYARGTIRVGKKVVDVAEFSTGCRARAEASTVAHNKEAEIRETLLGGDKARAAKLTVADCFLLYLKRPGGVPDSDADRVAEMNEHIGHMPFSEASVAWGMWLAHRGGDWAAATAARWRSIYVAALRYGAALNQVALPTVPVVNQPDDVRVRYLSREERDKLLACYNQHALGPITVMCFMGLRSQEALQIKRSDVNLEKNTLFVRKSKNGQARTLPIHPRARVEIEKALAIKRTESDANLFYSAKGKPYADTRGRGGNPLSQAHITALAKAEIDDFRPHDWRHHWASWMVMTGCDLHTLKRMGGWKDPRMVDRYAAVSIEHMEETMLRVA